MTGWLDALIQGEKDFTVSDTLPLAKSLPVEVDPAAQTPGGAQH